jgi:flavodoxin
VTAILILYASTSGSTRLLVQSVAAELGDATVECCDIKTLDRAPLSQTKI